MPDAARPNVNVAALSVGVGPSAPMTSASPERMACGAHGPISTPATDGPLHLDPKVLSRTVKTTPDL